MSSFRVLVHVIVGVAATVLGAAAHSAVVEEIAAADIEAVVASDRVTVVQFTSPDPRCGHCRGQAEAFDAFARSASDTMRIVRVQWTPWNKFPAMRLSARVAGVPSYFVYRRGEAWAVLPQTLIDPAWLRLKAEQAAADKRLPFFGTALRLQEIEKMRAASPQTTVADADAAQLRAWGRFALLDGAATTCGLLHASLEDALKNAQRRAKSRVPDATAHDGVIRRVGGNGTPAVLRITHEADQALAAEAPINLNSEAGCREVLSLIDKP